MTKSKIKQTVNYSVMQERGGKMILQNMKRKGYAFAAIILSVVMLSSNISVAADNKNNTAGTDDNQNATSYSQNDYYKYINNHNDVATASNTIILENSSAKLIDADIESIDGHNGAIVINQNGSAEWNINVNETALYYIKLDYRAFKTSNTQMQISLKTDGVVPFSGADYITLKRIWQDNGQITQGSNGNDIAPKQVEKLEWKTTYLEDYSSYFNGSFSIYIEKGNHTFSLTSTTSDIVIDNLQLNGGANVKSYNDISNEYAASGYKKVGNVIVKTQAETAYEKSDSTIIPVYDSTSLSTENADNSLNSPSRICRNTIGQSRWETTGMWVSYKINVPEDGLYKLQLKTRQNTKVGMSTLRDIYIDGELPFKEASGFVFPYSSDWKITTFGASEEQPYWIHLTAGEHEVKFVATLDTFSSILAQISDVNTTLTELYRRIVMVTGISPDANRDYNLDVEIPGMIDTISACKDKLYDLAEQYKKAGNGGDSQVAIVKSNAKQLLSFINDPDTIPKRLANFQANISSLSDWLQSAKSQALEIDYFVLSGDQSGNIKAQSGLLKSTIFSFRRFIASYISDYNSIGSTESDETHKNITVWFSGSRDQAQIIQDMIEESFTPKTNISVNLSLVYQGYIESILAGCGPDVALDVARSYPVNLACRGALIGLSQFDTFDDVMSRYGKGTAIPYTYKDEVYGIPSQQSFFMFFYRTDIFNELGLKAPNSWDDFYKIIPVLQRKNYEIGLPYSTITVAGTATGGIGAKDMYSTLLLQSGGKFYNSDLTSSLLDNDNAFNAFKTWTEFYTTYGFPVSYNVLTRFRSGTLPAFIAPYSTFNSLMAAAPEINGLWTMVPIPGTLKEDGTVDRTTSASGTANVIFKGAADPEACWRFIDWWSTSDTQYNYAVSLEALLGLASRSQTANLEAFNKLAWGNEIKENLATQRASVVEFEETPGEYVLSRSLDNAFRAVVYNGKNARERYEQEVITINEELERKSKEFK